jgi:hypothetical protein
VVPHFFVWLADEKEWSRSEREYSSQIQNERLPQNPSTLATHVILCMVPSASLLSASLSPVSCRLPQDHLRHMSPSIVSSLPPSNPTSRHPQSHRYRDPQSRCCVTLNHTGTPHTWLPGSRTSTGRQASLPCPSLLPPPIPSPPLGSTPSPSELLPAKTWTPQRPELLRTLPRHRADAHAWPIVARRWQVIVSHLSQSSSAPVSSSPPTTTATTWSVFFYLCDT